MSETVKTVQPAFIYFGEDYWQTPCIESLVAAKVAFNQEITPVTKDRTVPITNDGKKRQYATLDAVITHCSPVLAKHGLSVFQVITSNSLLTVLVHVSGEQIGSRWQLEKMWEGRGTNNLQNLGGTFSYLKRYAYSAIIGVATDDDDDGAGSTASPKKPSNSRSRPTPPSNSAPANPNPPKKKERAVMTLDSVMKPKNYNKILKKLKDGTSHDELIKLYSQTLDLEPAAINYIKEIDKDEEFQTETNDD